MPLLLLSNVGGDGGDWFCLCCDSSPCGNTFSNTVDIREVITNTIKDVYYH